MSMPCAPAEAFAIHTFATDRRHQARTRKHLIDQMQQYPDKVKCWMEQFPKHELREIALHYQRKANRTN